MKLKKFNELAKVMYQVYDVAKEYEKVFVGNGVTKEEFDNEFLQSVIDSYQSLIDEMESNMREAEESAVVISLEDLAILIENMIDEENRLDEPVENADSFEIWMRKRMGK